MASISVFTGAVSNTMSGGAAVAVLGPIVLKIASQAGENPLTIGFITALSSAFGYLTVFAAPACTIVYASGYLKSTDFLAAGWKMMVASIVVVLLAALLYWPLLGF
jgi:sodium-dependent dicarboxylate transporter 2/3/5